MSAKTSSKEKKQHKRGDRTVSTWIIFILMVGFLFAMWTSYRWIYTALLGFISAAATYEIVHAVKAKNKVLYAVAMCVAAFMPFVFSYHLPIPLAIAMPAYIMVLLVIMVAMNEKTKFVDVLAALYSSLWLSYGFSCFILIRDIHIKYPGTYTKWEGFFFVMLAFGLSWGPDSLAYLVGKKFGKHKLAPVISPKKTVEGAVGGLVLTCIGIELVLFIYRLIIDKALGSVCFESYGNMVYLYLLPFAALMTVISIFGDLAASVIKRNFGIKDYSSLFPGHGGIMDRFDSSLFVLPAIYASIVIINMV